MELPICKSVPFSAASCHIYLFIWGLQPKWLRNFPDMYFNYISNKTGCQFLIEQNVLLKIRPYPIYFLPKKGRSQNVAALSPSSTHKQFYDQTCYQ